MTSAEIAKRVERALIRLDYRMPSVAEWRDASVRYGADSGPAIGCLLALVREAWAQEAIGAAGEDLRIIIEESRSNRNRASVSVYAKWWRVYVKDTLIEALTVALEAAPC